MTSTTVIEVLGSMKWEENSLRVFTELLTPFFQETRLILFRDFDNDAPCDLVDVSYSEFEPMREADLIPSLHRSAIEVSTCRETASQ